MQVGMGSGGHVGGHSVIGDASDIIADGIASVVDGAAIGALGGLAMFWIDLYASAPNPFNNDKTVTEKGVRAVSRGVAYGVVIAVASNVAQKILSG